MQGKRRVGEQGTLKININLLGILAVAIGLVLTPAEKGTGQFLLFIFNLAFDCHQSASWHLNHSIQI